MKTFQIRNNWLKELTVGIANFGSRVEGILEVTSADLYGPSELRE